MQRVVVIAATLLALSVALSDVLADQVDQACEDPAGYRQIDSYEPTGQSFIPSERTHVGVELLIADCNPGAGAAEVSVVLREGTIGGSAVSGTDVTETYSGDGWVYFGFAAPVDLTPGQTYVIDVSAPSARGCLYYNDEGCYPDGSAWLSGSENPLSDYLFRTLVPTILYPTHDAFISMQDPNSNYGSGSALSVRNRYGGGGTDYWERNTLVKFDLSSIPHGSTITSATLHLYYYHCIFSNCNGRNLNCRRITSSWDEDTVTWNTRPGSAPGVTDQATVPSTFDWMDWDVTSDVQAIVDGEEDNEGWQIMDEVTWGASSIPDERFRSKEYGDYLPYLEIVYESQPSVRVPSLTGWGVVTLALLIFVVGSWKTRATRV